MEQRQLSQLLALSVELQRSIAAMIEPDSATFAKEVLRAVQVIIPADATALLLLQGESLTPIAVHGLVPESLGRRFLLDAHPRLKEIANSNTTVRFAPDCALPDPYDGLLIASHGDIPVHACMGMPLGGKEQTLALLTFDSLTPDAFNAHSSALLTMLQTIVTTAFNTVLQLQRLHDLARHNRAVVSELSHVEVDMIGEHPSMQKLKQEMQLVAGSDLSVLIFGETGTGKELVARHIHQQSGRRDKPYVQLNCASLPEGVAESELFGHRKGAFTGADRHREGKFLLADGGTLFLDEIGELPLNLQSKLLRALQSGEIQPVGADSTSLVDVRIIAASNRDLREEVAVGRFRADLYHRLSVYPINVPALRARQSDIALLSGYFVEQLRKKLHLQQLVLSQTFLQSLQNYDWPGNVRELEHVISRAALKAKHALWPKQIIKISPEHSELGAALPPRVKAAEILAEGGQSLKAATDHFQTELIKRTLTWYHYNWAAAARALQVDRGNLVRLAKRLQIEVKKSL
ncbi:nitric oxide reductase transcriptional regulator NorR [Pseudoalteromonas fenneropenaei]|uniref:Nitric oxide reductase transcriptional regulator NorR n=1 Tax=Pseudoalteromonas fenneropenaei TaxID=1737459 RepID=A0ABV7CJX8_9GAMM